MNYPTYTTDGLTKKLHRELKKGEVDTELVTRINNEIKSRLVNPSTQMSPKEQIYWILKDTNFERIHQAMIALDWSWGGGRTPTIIELIHSAENLLNKVAHAEEGDYQTFYTSTGGLHAEKTIWDGVMCLSLKFVVSGWEMDYDSVTCDNYSDKPAPDNWDSVDVGTWVYNEEEEE